MSVGKNPPLLASLSHFTVTYIRQFSSSLFVVNWEFSKKCCGIWTLVTVATFSVYVYIKRMLHMCVDFQRCTFFTNVHVITPSLESMPMCTDSWPSKHGCVSLINSSWECVKEPQYMDTCRGVSALGRKINILNEKVDFLHSANLNLSQI